MSKWIDRLRPGAKRQDASASVPPMVPPTTPDRPTAEFGDRDIQGVRITEVQRGIPMPNWESVEATLQLYGSGKVEGSKATRAYNVKAFSEAYGADAGQAFFASIAPSGPTGRFVEYMMAEAKPAVDERNRWSRHYDYDGVGVFHKTSVEVSRAPKGEPAEYVLGIHAAYVGDKPEKDLAEALGVERATLSKAVTVEFAPEGDRFRIDMDAVAGRLATVFGNGGKDRRGSRISGKAIADHFMSRDQYGHPVEEAYTIGEMDGFRVALSFGRVGGHINYDVDRTTEQWQREGNTLRGGLADDYEDRAKHVAPSLVLSLVDARKERYDDCPVISPERKATMQAVAQRLADAFQPKTA